MNRRVAFQDKFIPLFHFWPLKWLLQCIQGQSWKPKQTVKKGQSCQIRQKFLLTVGGGKRLTGCWQISLISNWNVNGLNETISSQIYKYIVHIVVVNKLILCTEWCPKIDLFTFKGHDRVQRVPTLRAFWDLEKPCYMKFVLVGLYCGPLLTLLPPLTHT